MKTMKQKYVRWTVEGILAAFVLVCRFVPDCGEWYARTVYPSISFVLSACTSWIPFSLEEWVVAGCVVALVLIPWAGRKKKASWRTVLRREAELLVIVWCWFYVGWGPIISVMISSRVPEQSGPNIVRMLSAASSAPIPIA